MKILTHSLTLLAISSLLSCDKKEDSSSSNTRPAKRVPSTSISTSTAHKNTQGLKSKKEQTNDFIKSIDSMSRQELIALINDPALGLEGIAKKNETAYYIAFTKAFESLGKLDPHKAIELAKKMPANFKVLGIKHVFISWGALDFEKATEMAHSLDQESLIVQAINGSITGLVAVDSDKAYKMAVNKNDRFFLDQFFMKWAEVDTLAAFTKASELDDNTMKSGLISSITQALLLGNNTKGIMQLLNSPSNKEDRLTLIKGLNTNWQALAPEIIHHLESLTDPKEQDLAQKILAKQAIYTNPAQAAEEMLKMSDVDTTRGSDNFDKIVALMTAYSEKDAAGARAFFEKLPDGDLKNAAYPHYLINLATSDPDIALKHILENDNIGNSSGHYASIGQLLTDQDVQARVELILGSESPNATFLLSSIYNSWPHQDLPAASKHLENIDPKFKNIDQLYGKVAFAYKTNPEEGVIWIAGIEDEKNKKSATASFVDGWLYQDIDGVVDWVNTLEISPQRNTAVKALSSRLIYNGDADLAIEWAESISDDEVKEKTMNDIFFRWLLISPDEAKSRLEETNLISEKDKDAIKTHPVYNLKK